MKAFIIYLTGLALCSSVYAEIRVWQDVKGNQYEAEYVRELFEKVTLRDIHGEEHTIPIEQFSENDKQYIRVMVPPNVEIDFSKTSQLKPEVKQLWDSYNDTVMIVTGTVRMEKKVKRPFTSRLYAELFLIGEEFDGDNYVLVSKTDSSFLFTDQDYFEFKTDPVEIRLYTEYNEQRRGVEYMGHVIVLSDARGNILEVVTDIKWLSDKVEELRELYLRGSASMFSRHFDKSAQKTQVPRPRYFATRNAH